MHPNPTLPLLGLLCLGASMPAAPQDPPEEPPRVAARLVSSLSRVAPGAEFEVGLHLAVPPGWHVYWENPGDTGMDTTASLVAPEGFEVEGPRYPGPHLFEQPGDLKSYGYEGDVVLFFGVRAPEQALDGPLRFRAEADWLVCKEVCFLGQAEPALELASGAESVATAGTDASLLTAQRALLPRPWGELGDRVGSRWGAPVEDGEGGRRFELDLTVDGAERLRFFPSRAEQAELRGQSFEKGKQVGRLRLQLAQEAAEEGAAPPVPRIRGVLRVETGEEVAYYRVDLSPPGAASGR